MKQRVLNEKLPKKKRKVFGFEDLFLMR